MSELFKFPRPLEVPRLSSITIFTKGKKARIDSSLSGGALGSAARFYSMVRRAPEVMVKITGGGKTAGQVFQHLTYIGRNGKVVIENEEGDTLQAPGEVRDELAGWGIDTMKGAGRYRQAHNVMLSMPKGTPPEKVLEAARKFAQERFGGERPYMLALHTDKAHPHVHICVRMEGYEPGQRLFIRKPDLQAYREQFAQKMTERGIEATATPRDWRGVTRKGQKPGVYRAAKAGRSTVIKSAISEAVSEVKNGQKNSEPWKAHIEARRNTIVEQYKGMIAEAESKGKFGFAAEMRRFMEALPPIKTQQDMIRQSVSEKMQKQQPEKRPHRPGPEMER